MQNTLTITVLAILCITIAPAFGYTWTVNNGLPEETLVKFNISGATREFAINSTGKEVFNGPRSICLTNMYIMRMGTDNNWVHVKLQNGDPKLWSDVVDDIQDLVEALSEPESPTEWIKLLGNLIKTLVDILKNLCSDGDFLLTHHPDNANQLYMIKKG